MFVMWISLNFRFQSHVDKDTLQLYKQNLI